MRITIRWNERPRGADVAFITLAGLAAIILGMLTGSTLEYALRYVSQLRSACESAWIVLRSSTVTTPALVPTALLATVLSAAALALVRQMRATRRLIGAALSRRVSPSQRLLAAAEALGLADRIDVVADGRVYSFCYGLLSPRICLTTGLLELLEDDELDALLLHERYHVLCHDPLKVLLSRTWAGGLFFIPLAQDLRDRYLRAKEIEADDMTAADVRRQMPLASALLKVLTSEQRLRYQTLAAIGAFGMSMTEERIERLVSPRRSPVTVSFRLARAVVSALIVGLIVLTSLRPFLTPNPVRADNECTNHVSFNVRNSGLGY